MQVQTQEATQEILDLKEAKKKWGRLCESVSRFMIGPWEDPEKEILVGGSTSGSRQGE